MAVDDMVSDRNGGPRANPADRERPVPGWSAFGLFSESLLTGVLVVLGSVAVVTFLPALAAGTSHLRRYLSGNVTTVRAFADDLVAAMRRLWPLAVVFPVVVGLLIVNGVLVGSGAVPGGVPLLIVTVALAVAVTVVSLRAATLLHPPAALRELLQRATVRTRSDLGGSALIVLAVGLCVVLVWMLTPLIVVVPGLLALALVVVDVRASLS